MKFVSESASYSHNLSTYDYVRENAPVLRETFHDEMFTRLDYENHRNNPIDRLYHKGFGLNSAVRWGFVEIAKVEHFNEKYEIVYKTPSGKRICSASDYDKMDEEVINALKNLYGELIAELVAIPCNKVKRYYYKWNEEKYQEWLTESQKIINNKIQHKIALEELKLKVLKNKML